MLAFGISFFGVTTGFELCFDLRLDRLKPVLDSESGKKMR
jgi:hypothetical protein